MILCHWLPCAGLDPINEQRVSPNPADLSTLMSHLGEQPDNVQAGMGCECAIAFEEHQALHARLITPLRPLCAGAGISHSARNSPAPPGLSQQGELESLAHLHQHLAAQQAGAVPLPCGACICKSYPQPYSNMHSRGSSCTGAGCHAYAAAYACMRSLGESLRRDPTKRAAAQGAPQRSSRRSSWP